MKKISTINMSREEWLKLRKNGIGGSDAGSVCGGGDRGRILPGRHHLR